MVLDICKTPSIGLINIFPCAFRYPIPNLRASLLSEVANIGCNTTKNDHYYGLKFSNLVNDNGFLVYYVAASTPSYLHWRYSSIL
jgi:hypothetical protein